jgi:colicin import membrane protein
MKEYENRKKNKRIAFWGTFSFIGSILVLLIIFGFSTPLPLPEEEGILVNLGYDDSGMGQIETGGEAVPEQTIPEESTPPPPTETETEENIMTQDFEDAAAMEAKKEEARKKREEEIRQQKEREEELRKQRELEEKRKKEEEERKKIEDITKNAFSNGGQQGSESESDGNNGGNGNQGDPNGDPNAKNYGEGKGLGDKGIGYSLEGRTPQGGRLPKPVYSANESGTVVIRVNVDRDGNVTSASFQAKGSTTTNSQLIRAALNAARKAKFNQDNNADAFQVGTITYRFVLQ